MKRLLDWRGHLWLALLARLYLGYVFIQASLHKIADPLSFAVDVATYQLLPLPLINLLALWLPWLELLAGALLLVGWRSRAAALLVTGMMVMFMVALGWALHQELDMSCGCFASSGEADQISSLTMLRDLGWLSLAVYLLIFDRRPLGVDGWLAARAARAAGARPA